MFQNRLLFRLHSSPKFLSFPFNDWKFLRTLTVWIIIKLFWSVSSSLSSHSLCNNEFYQKVLSCIHLGKWLIRYNKYNKFGLFSNTKGSHCLFLFHSFFFIFSGLAYTIELLTTIDYLFSSYWWLPFHDLEVG